MVICASLRQMISGPDVAGWYCCTQWQDSWARHCVVCAVMYFLQVLQHPRDFLFVRSVVPNQIILRYSVVLWSVKSWPSLSDYLVVCVYVSIAICHSVSQADSLQRHSHHQTPGNKALLLLCAPPRSQTFRSWLSSKSSHMQESRQSVSQSATFLFLFRNKWDAAALWVFSPFSFGQTNDSLPFVKRRLKNP